MPCILISTINKAASLAHASITQPFRSMFSRAKTATMESSVTLELAPLRAMSPCVGIIHSPMLLISAQGHSPLQSVSPAQLKKPNSALLILYAVNRFILIVMVQIPLTMDASTQQLVHLRQL